MRIRRARVTDAEAIHALISAHASSGGLLPRTLEEVHRAIPDFLVAAQHGRVAGCVALESYGAALAEIRSLVVAQESRGSGLGRKLLREATEYARKRDIARLLVVTGAGGFFERQGFARLPGGMPAEKVARDCARCPKVAGCRLMALTLELSPASTRRSLLSVIQPVGLPRIPGTVPA